MTVDFLFVDLLNLPDPDWTGFIQIGQIGQDLSSRNFVLQNAHAAH